MLSISDLYFLSQNSWIIYNNFSMLNFYLQFFIYSTSFYRTKFDNKHTENKNIHMNIFFNHSSVIYVNGINWYNNYCTFKIAQEKRN